MMAIIVILTLLTIGYVTLAFTPSYNTEEDCRSCHGNNTIDRHHLLAANGTYNCINCHPLNWSTENQSFKVEVIRNCLICHVGKNHTNVHHLLASQGLYVCLDCHRMLYNESTGQYYPEVIRECPVCHLTVIGPTPTPTPTDTSTPTPTPTPTDTPTPTPPPDQGPTGLHSSIDCSLCHQTQETEEDICYQCHNDSSNSYHGINISYQFTVRNDNFSGMPPSEFYKTVNTRHDITSADQAYSFSRMECTNCHSAHKADRTNITIDPDDGSPFNKNIIHPGTREIISDSIIFCLKCHDNTWSPNVTGPSAIVNIGRTYSNIKGDEHGIASGRNNSRLIGPYNGIPSKNVPPMPCTDCHDLHGGKGIYHLKTLTDQYGKNITITSFNIDNHTVAHWCSHCHYNPMNQLDSNKGNCLKSGCHIHGRKF